MPFREQEITQDVLLTLSKVDTGKNVYILRIASWNKRRPKLEKRTFWKKEGESELRMSKIIGLDADDIKLIVEKKDEILRVLEQWK